MEPDVTPSASITAGNEAVKRLEINQDADRLTHRLFRFPAKFHPPVVATLIEKYTDPGDHLYDPFCGSGTALVEAAIGGRLATGVDLDPLAVAVSLAKTRRYDIGELERAAERLLAKLNTYDRGGDVYAQLQWRDISESEYEAVTSEEKLWIPAIPRLGHWFRRYVVVDLARMRRAIVLLRHISADSRGFFLLIFAAIIRNASNADPVPVSGLEVTSHMKSKDEKGRIINPFALYRRALVRSLSDVTEWVNRLNDNDLPKVLQGDATESVPGTPKVSAILTSPPYHSAVDYYRRHQLEMFWLRLTESQDDRLKLLPRYIGRARVRQSHPLLQQAWQQEGLAGEWERLLASEDPERARAFRHYILAMSRAFKHFASITDKGAPVLVVVGSSTWNGKSIPTADLFYELAGNAFEHDPPLWYPVKNRYMSYARKNEANIDKEYVVILRRR